MVTQANAATVPILMTVVPPVGFMADLDGSEGTGAWPVPKVPGPSTDPPPVGGRGIRSGKGTLSMQVRAQDTIQVFLRTSTVQPHLREPRPHRSRVPTEVLQSAEGRAPEVRPVETEASAASLRYRRSEKTTLQIRTQEGDVVRIKFQARESLRVKAERGGEADPESTELELSARSSSKLSIKTQGHLNAGELAAIRDAVDQATQIADGFFAGDLQAAFETASAFDVDGEQLARVKLKLRVRERVAYTAQGFTSVQAKIGPGL